MEERELCIWKETTKQRNIKRIPVICNKIKELWLKYNNFNIKNFCEIIDYIQFKAESEEYITDPFYWEEDLWYDKIAQWTEEINNCNQLKLSDKQLNTMNQIVKYFENYWRIFPDFRLQQIFNLFNELVIYERENEQFDINWWKEIMVTEQISILTNSINTLKNNILETNSGNNNLIKYSIINKENYIKLMNTYVSSTEKQLQDLKKEYGLK